MFKGWRRKRSSTVTIDDGSALLTTTADVDQPRFSVSFDSTLAPRAHIDSKQKCSDDPRHEIEAAMLEQEQFIADYQIKNFYGRPRSSNNLPSFRDAAAIRTETRMLRESINAPSVFRVADEGS